MPDTPTPGQVAYAAYWRTCAYARVPLILPWSALAPDQHRAWEAAAQAVLTAARPRLVPVEDQQLAMLRALAQEARPFLEAAFGAVLREIVVHVQHDGGSGESLMRVVARVASDETANLEGLLRYFDETWWLANCHRAGGNLVFDYETIPFGEALDDAATAGGNAPGAPARPDGCPGGR